MTDRTYRRLFGIVFCAALGLAFGVTSQAVNPLLMPGVTFHQPPLGLWGNLVGAALACGLIGLIVAWWDNTLTSILIAAVLTGLCVELVGAFYGTYIPPAEVGPLLVTLLILWLPMTGLLGAVFFLLRWIINKQVEQRRDRTALWRRVVWPGLALIIAGGFGALAIYPAEGQLRVREMDALIQAGLRSPDRTALPSSLSTFAEPLLQHAAPGYTLQWIRGDGLPPWRIGQPAGYQSWELSIVAARFADGWILACLFLPRTTDIRCQSYDRDPTVKRPPEP